MATDAQRTANRANAQASTGPRTAQGKETVSKNALAHGLTAHRHLVVHDEDAEEFQSFVDGMVASLEPEGELEEAFAGRVATGMWRLRRAVDLETLVLRMARHDASPAAGLAVAFALVRDERYGAALDRLGRAEERLERSVAHALRELEALQDRRTTGTNPNYTGSIVRRGA